MAAVNLIFSSFMSIVEMIVSLPETNQNIRKSRLWLIDNNKESLISAQMSWGKNDTIKHEHDEGK